MNFLEKYIQRQEKKSAKHSLLQTYLISLISLSLTVTMLLGTTMAWFTTTVDVPQNEIYVGNLEVDFELIDQTAAVDENGQLQGVSLITEENNEQLKVFSDDIIWQAGHVEVRTFRITNNGEIPFTYYLSLTTPKKDSNDQNDAYLVTMPDPNDPNKAKEVEDPTEFLKLFEVYAKIGDAQGFENGELLNQNVWTKVGTLDKLVTVLTQDDRSVTVINDLEAFRGKLDPLSATQTSGSETQAPSTIHSIAIKMSENAANNPENEIDYGGYQLNFGIKMVASQIGTPETVVSADKMAALLDQGYNVKLSHDITLKKPLNLNGNLINGQVIAENAGENDKRSELKIAADMAENTAIITTGGTVRYVTVMGADYEKSVAITTGDQELKQNLYIDNVTIDTVAKALQIKGNGQSKVQVTNSIISGEIYCTNISSLEFVTCTLGDTASAYGSLIVGSNVTFTDCEFSAGKFKLIPEEVGEENSTEKIVVTFDNCTIDGVKVTDVNLLAQLGIGDNFSDRYDFVFVNDSAN